MPIEINKENVLKYVAINRLTQRVKGKSYGPHDAYTVSKSDNCICPPGVHNFSIGRKFDDVVAAGFAGALAYSDRHGDDAIAVIDDELVGMELKLGAYNRNQFLVSKGGELVFKSKSTKTKTFRTGASAHYEIKNNTASKRRYTVFVLVDDSNYQLIDMLMLKPDAAYECVTTYFDGSPREQPPSNKISISVNRFVKTGTRHRPEGVEVLGLEQWEVEVSKLALGDNPVKLPGSSHVFENRKIAEAFLANSACSHLTDQLVAA